MTLYEEFFDLWKGFNELKWRRYAGDPHNDELMLEAASNWRPCITCFERAFATVKNELIRTDGRTDEDDKRDAAQRAAAREARLQAETVVTREDLYMFGSLSRRELFELCQRDPEVNRKYKKACADHGYRPFNQEVA